jgi:hypothetical protein
VQVRNVRWIGVSTENYPAMRELFETVMGLRPNFDEATTVEFATSEGDEIQLMAPGDPYFDFFREHAHGPVPLFEVDDVHSARCRIRVRDLARAWKPPDYDDSSARRDHQASAAVIALSAWRMSPPTSPAVAAQCRGTRASAPGSQRCSSGVNGFGAVPS